MLPTSKFKFAIAVSWESQKLNFCYYADFRERSSVQRKKGECHYNATKTPHDGQKESYEPLWATKLELIRTFSKISLKQHEFRSLFTKLGCDSSERSGCTASSQSTKARYENGLMAWSRAWSFIRTLVSTYTYTSNSITRVKFSN